MTNGALTMDEKIVRPRKFLYRTNDKAASVPSTMDKVALTKPI
jgi:hypothetical protein